MMKSRGLPFYTGEASSSSCRKEDQVADQAHALILVRTPLQARLAGLVLEEEKPESFDLIYFADHRSPKHFAFFQQLSKHARNSFFLVGFPRHWRILGEIFLFWRASAILRHWGSSYSITVLASIDSFPIGGIAYRSMARLVTIDDGAANLNYDGFLYQQNESRRGRLYRSLFGLPSIADIRELIQLHYTVFRDQPNIVPMNKIKYLESWPPARQSVSSADEKTFAIGTGDHWMNRPQVLAVQTYLQSAKIDYYLPHHTEKGQFPEGVELLEIADELAEEAIISISGDAKIRLVGAFSTVFLTMEKVADSRLVLCPPGHEWVLPLAAKSGFDVLPLR